MKVVLAAEEAAGVQALRALATSGHGVAAVLTSASVGEGRGASVADVAANLGYDVLPARLVTSPDFAASVRAAGIDLLLNVHSLHIVHREVLAAPKIGAFNLHPGPLPSYAGLNAPSWAIIRHERRHAVTVHWMAPGIDTGPTAYSAEFEIGDSDTGLSVSARCVRLGVPLLLRLVEAAARDPGAIPAVAQDLTKRHYYGRAVPYGGRVCWSLPARELVAFVRAADFHPLRSPWGSPTARLGAMPIEIVSASRTFVGCTTPPGTVGQPIDGAAAVAAGDEWVRVHRLRVGGALVDPRDALHPGECLGEGG